MFATHPTLPLDHRPRISRPVVCVLGLLVSVAWFADSCQAQIVIRRGFRVATPVVPPFGPPLPPLVAPPWVPPPPGRVRIRSPYFSLRIGPSFGYRYSFGPDAYSGSYGYSAGPYGYSAGPYGYSGSYGYGWSGRTDRGGYRYGDTTQDPSRRPYSASRPPDGPIYSPGQSGGIPDVTDESAVAPDIPPAYDPPATDSRGFSAAALRRAAQRLIDALARRGETGDIWLEYLQPQAIVDAIDRGDPIDDAAARLTRYESVTANPELGSIVRTPGFRQVLQELQRYVRRPNSDDADQDTPDRSPPGRTDDSNPPQFESLPAPTPTASPV